jgi:hypothetical protein
VKPSSDPVGTGGVPYPWEKSNQGTTLQCSDKIKTELELYLLYSKAPPWYVVGWLTLRSGGKVKHSAMSDSITRFFSLMFV